MKLMIGALATALTVCASNASAEPLKLGQATEGHTYFNRPGTSIDEHNDTLLACAQQAAKIRSVDEVLNGQSGIVGDLVVAAVSRGVRPAAIENCMVVRGWRVIRLPEEEGATLAEMEPSALQQTLADWVSLETPHGEIARVWNNDAADGATDRYELRPAVSQRVSLSVQSLQLTFERQVVTEPPLIQARSIRQDRLRPPGPDETLVLFQIRGVSLRGGNGIDLVRFNPEDGLIAAGTRDAPNYISVSTSLLGNREAGNWRAFIVPAGRYRLYNFQSGLILLNLCLGAPAFEVHGGEVVFGGVFDLGAQNVGPNLDLTPARAWLAQNPALAEAIKPAEYTNGWTGECRFNSIYAIEFAGAPFREGYQWGSNAQSVTTSSAMQDAEPGEAGAQETAATEANALQERERAP
jgi:hypothetical protein